MIYGGCAADGEFVDGKRLGKGFTPESCIEQCMSHNTFLAYKGVEIDDSPYPTGPWKENRLCTGAELLRNIDGH